MARIAAWTGVIAMFCKPRRGRLPAAFALPAVVGKAMMHGATPSVGPTRNPVN